MQATRASEQVARVVGAVAAVLTVGVIALIRARTETDADWETLGDLLVFIFLGPVVAMLCLAALVCLLIALIRTRGRITGSTWILSLPASLAGATVFAWAVSGGSVDLDWLFTS